MYSSYKSHTTLKALIAVIPNGSACFISPLYEGSIDDVAITEKSGFLDYLEPDDLILEDNKDSLSKNFVIVSKLVLTSLLFLVKETSLLNKIFASLCFAHYSTALCL